MIEDSWRFGIIANTGNQRLNSDFQGIGAYLKEIL